MKQSRAKRKSSRAQKILIPSSPHDPLEVSGQEAPANKNPGQIELGRSIALEVAEGALGSRRKTFREFIEQVNHLLENQIFYIFRTDNNQVLARGIEGFENAKQAATSLRKKHGLKWDQVRFKAERSQRSNQFGVSSDGRRFKNAYGQQSRIDYARRYNPSKGRRFRGYTDAEGNYHDID